MKINYRPATDKDYEFCRSLHHQGMRPYVEPLWDWKDDFQNQRYERLLRPENIKIIQLDSKENGYIEVSWTSEVTKLVNIFVTKNLRGNGIGTRLF